MAGAHHLRGQTTCPTKKNRVPVAKKCRLFRDIFETEARHLREKPRRWRDTSEIFYEVCMTLSRKTEKMARHFRDFFRDWHDTFETFRDSGETHPRRIPRHFRDNIRERQDTFETFRDGGETLPRRFPRQCRPFSESFGPSARGLAAAIPMCCRRAVCFCPLASVGTPHSNDAPLAAQRGPRLPQSHPAPRAPRFGPTARGRS